jgi:hypothetical protein
MKMMYSSTLQGMKRLVTLTPKNSYWYKVLVDIIQELSLRAIVNGDGQTVWTNIVTEAKKSTTARISSQSLTAYLTTNKI